MKLEDIKSSLSDIINVYAFGVGSLNGEIVNLNLYGVKEPDVSRLKDYLENINQNFIYQESSNKLEKTFIFTVGEEIKTQHYLENNKPKQKLYLSI